MAFDVVHAKDLEWHERETADGSAPRSYAIVTDAAHLTESLLSAGFSRVRVTKRKMSGKILTPYRDPAGRFSRSITGRHVYGEEFIVIANR